MSGGLTMKQRQAAGCKPDGRLSRKKLCLTLFGIILVGLCASIILGANCAYAQGLDVSKGAFGKTSDGTSVDKYALTNTHGMAVTILTYGGIVQTIEMPDKNGNLAKVSLA